MFDECERFFGQDLVHRADDDDAMILFFMQQPPRGGAAAAPPRDDERRTRKDRKNAVISIGSTNDRIARLSVRINYLGLMTNVTDIFQALIFNEMIVMTAIGPMTATTRDWKRTDSKPSPIQKTSKALIMMRSSSLFYVART